MMKTTSFANISFASIFFYIFQWAESHEIMSVYTVGRDMGAAPPRQTELRMKLPGN